MRHMNKNNPDSVVGNRCRNVELDGFFFNISYKKIWFHDIFV